MADFFYYLTMTLFVAVSIILMMLILIQKGRGGGLASAFGGVGGHTAFGSKTGDVLTWATAIVFGVFLILGVLANVSFNQLSKAAGKPTATAVVPQAPAKTTPGANPPVTADPGVKNPPPGAPIDKPGPTESSTPTAAPTTQPK